jgi:hypothetical protein
MGDDSGAIQGATVWLDAIFAGQLTMAIGIVAVAGLGLSMLSGRIQIRRALAIALGVFIIFGAPSIARGILTSYRPSQPPDFAPLPLAPVPEGAEGRKVQNAYDPYAGASLRN